MKRSLKSRYQILLIIFFAIFILQSTLILLSLIKPVGFYQLRDTIHSIVIFFILVQFIYFIVMLYYIPYQYERGLKEIYQIIEDISEGKYQIDMDLKTHLQNEEITSLITAMQKMMNIVNRFDHLKSDKIYEHHMRLQQLIEMLPQGCLILSIVGEIVHLNDFIKKNFPELTENLNIIENLMPPYIEDGFKLLILNSLKNSENLHDKLFKSGVEQTAYKLNSSIVRSRRGYPVGAIFIITQA